MRLLLLIVGLALVVGCVQSPTGNVVGEPGKDCTIFPGTQLQLKCYLEQGTLEMRDHVCQDVRDSLSCEQLFNRGGRCDQVPDKQACLKDAARYNERDLTSVRDYTVLLLHELQDEAVESYRVGRISSTSGAQMLNSIALIQRATLNEEIRSSLQARVANFQNEWTRLMR